MTTTKFPRLFKKSKIGKISMWEIYTQANQIITVHGYVDGEKQYDKVIATPKNVGRSNETTGETQAISEAKAKWVKQKEKGYTEDPSGEAVMEVYLPMLAQKFKERWRDIKYPCFVQPKLNGMRCISYMKNGKRVYQSRLGKFWNTLEHLTKELEPFHNLILDGEIYLPGVDLQDIASLVKNQSDNEVNGLMASDLQYHVYDIILPEFTFSERLAVLKDVFDNLDFLGETPKYVIPVYTSRVLSRGSIEEFHRINLKNKYEGTMIRNANGLYALNTRSNDLQKYKPVLDGEFKIVGGYMVETGREEGTCVFTCITENGKTFDVRPKGTLEKRKKYWRDLEKLKGKMLTCEFQEFTSEGKPFHARGVAVRDYE